VGDSRRGLSERDPRQTASLFSAAAEMGSIGNGPDGECGPRWLFSESMSEWLFRSWMTFSTMKAGKKRRENHPEPIFAKTPDAALIHAMNTAPVAELDRVRKMFGGNLTRNSGNTSVIHPCPRCIGYSVRKAEEFAALAQCQLKCLDPSLAKDSCATWLPIPCTEGNEGRAGSMMNKTFLLFCFWAA